MDTMMDHFTNFINHPLLFHPFLVMNFTKLFGGKNRLQTMEELHRIHRRRWRRWPLWCRHGETTARLAHTACHMWKSVEKLRLKCRSSGFEKGFSMGFFPHLVYPRVSCGKLLQVMAELEDARAQ